MGEAIVSIDTDAVCPIVNRIMISAMDDGFEGMADSEAMTHAVAHVAAAMVMLQHQGFRLEPSIRKAARQIADKYARRLGAMNGRGGK